jgi:hypothetical protein
MTGYGLNDRGVGVRIPTVSRILSSLRRPRRLSGPSSLLFNRYRSGSMKLTTHLQLLSTSGTRWSTHPRPIRLHGVVLNYSYLRSWTTLHISFNDTCFTTGEVEGHEKGRVKSGRKPSYYIRRVLFCHKKQRQDNLDWGRARKLRCHKMYQLGFRSNCHSDNSLDHYHLTVLISERDVVCYTFIEVPSEWKWGRSEGCAGYGNTDWSHKVFPITSKCVHHMSLASWFSKKSALTSPNISRRTFFLQGLEVFPVR